jgi:hypothetical protein
VRVLAPLVRAIVALKGDAGRARAAAQEAFEAALEVGDVDSFVCVYRAQPKLLAFAC